MAIVRRTRILLAAIFALIIFFTTRHYEINLPQTSSSWREAYRDPQPIYKPPPNSLNKEEIPLSSPSNNDGLNEHDHEKDLPLENTGYTPIDPSVVPDAHKLAHADAFLAHFQAVTQLPGLTMSEAKSSCIWPDTSTSKVNFQYGPGQEWVVTDRPDSELAERRRQWHHFVDNDMIPYADARSKFHGRGLVIVAGNQDTMMRVKVILHTLLRLNSSIAVEVNHYGPDELSNSTKKELGAIYFHTFFNDLSDDSQIYKIDKNGFYVNYQLKTAAVLNSRFAEPLLLDSDNIPVIDPALLYESETYKEYGTVFWPDIARTRPNNPAWVITNTPCASKEEYEQESGQMLVDKRRFFYHLQLAAWFNNDPSQRDYWSAFLLGDKDMFRFAWHALRTKYGRPRRWLTSIGTLNDGYYCGHTFAQWHPDDGIPGTGSGKGVAFMHGGLVKTTDLEVVKWNREEKGGIYRHFKRAPQDADPGVSVDVGIKFDGASYVPENVKSEGFHGASCTDLFEVEARPLDELVPGFEKLFESVGGYWMLDKEKVDALKDFEEEEGSAEGGDEKNGDEKKKEGEAEVEAEKTDKETRDLNTEDSNAEEMDKRTNALGEGEGLIRRRRR